MKQGGAPATGKWHGRAAGGVTSPDIVIVPDVRRRFAATADRLAALAPGHPLEDWLSFMARLAAAQDHAAAVTGIESAPSAIVRRAAEADIPLLSADGPGRHPVWRSALSHILDAMEDGPLPEQARAVTTGLRATDAPVLEALADQFLRSSIEINEVGAAIYVAAALQVCFTAQATHLPTDALPLLSQRGLCPCCGSTPVAGLITASGKTPGVRYLFCSLCSTAWNHVRATCITCGDTRSIALRAIEGDDSGVKAETCDACRTYAKMIYQKQDMKADPFADDLASLALDILTAEAGWSRHAPNPLLLVGQAQ